MHPIMFVNRCNSLFIEGIITWIALYTSKAINFTLRSHMENNGQSREKDMIELYIKHIQIYNRERRSCKSLGAVEAHKCHLGSILFHGSSFHKLNTRPGIVCSSWFCIMILPTLYITFQVLKYAMNSCKLVICLQCVAFNIS